jgi:adenylate kinase
MYIILMGPQGSGKGTQAERMLPRLGLVAIATGDLFRAAAKAGTPLGLRAKEIMDRGELVPDDVTVGLVAERLAAIDSRRANGEDIRGALFDGFPRTAAQADALDVLLAGRGEEVDAVVSIDVPREVLVERLAGRRTCPSCNAVYHVIFNPPRHDMVCDKDGTPLVQRSDDTAEAVRKRLAAYEEKTAPLLALYAGRGLVRNVDGAQAIDDVTEAIAAVVAPHGERVG